MRKYRDMETFRDGRTLVRVSNVEPYRAYLEQRWAEGCTEAKQLWSELQAQGYSGSYRRVWSFTRYWQIPPLPAYPSMRPAPRAPARTPRQGMWLLMLPAKKLTQEEEAFRLQMCERSEEVAAAYDLVQAFRKMLEEGEVEQLDNWLERAKTSGVRELRRFALGLENDAAAVRAALEHKWSNGQVEGQVTRLKLLKRQMYGRAKFNLLRSRVLYCA